jgi:Fe-S cluster assembly scaffold protein SufB
MNRKLWNQTYGQNINDTDDETLARSWAARDDQEKAEAEAMRVHDAKIKAEVETALAQRDAEWTRETTITRRAEWNALVKGGAITTRGKVDWHKVRAAQTRLGWTMDDLKTAVTKHNL